MVLRVGIGVACGAGTGVGADVGTGVVGTGFGIGVDVRVDSGVQAASKIISTSRSHIISRRMRVLLHAIAIIRLQQ